MVLLGDVTGGQPGATAAVLAAVRRWARRRAGNIRNARQATAAAAVRVPVLWLVESPGVDGYDAARAAAVGSVARSAGPAELVTVVRAAVGGAAQVADGPTSAAVLRRLRGRHTLPDAARRRGSVPPGRAVRLPASAACW